MKSQVVKAMVPELLWPQERKVILYVFLWEILAKMTQVSDVAPGPLVILWVFVCLFFVCNNFSYYFMTIDLVMSFDVDSQELERTFRKFKIP
jgi:hypothetical protein